MAAAVPATVAVEGRPDADAWTVPWRTDDVVGTTTMSRRDEGVAAVGW